MCAYGIIDNRLKAMCVVRLNLLYRANILEYVIIDTSWVFICTRDTYTRTQRRRSIHRYYIIDDIVST